MLLEVDPRGGAGTQRSDSFGVAFGGRVRALPDVHALWRGGLKPSAVVALESEGISSAGAAPLCRQHRSCQGTSKL